MLWRSLGVCAHRDKALDSSGMHIYMYAWTHLLCFFSLLVGKHWQSVRVCAFCVVWPSASHRLTIQKHVPGPTVSALKR